MWGLGADMGSQRGLGKGGEARGDAAPGVID